MADTPRLLALIPARGNSKGLPGKNILPFGDAPLIAHTIAAARDAGCFATVLVSTDAPEIREVALQHGAEAPFLRPAALSGDTAGTLDVVRHAVDFCAAQGRAHEVVVLLQPTSPLRTARHIREALALYQLHSADAPCTVVSVVAQDGKFNWLLGENPDASVSFLRPAASLSRQQLGKVYLPNGAIYICATAALGEGFFTARTFPYPMAAADSIDIDTRADFDAALAQLGQADRGPQAG